MDYTALFKYSTRPEDAKSRRKAALYKEREEKRNKVLEGRRGNVFEDDSSQLESVEKENKTKKPKTRVEMLQQWKKEKQRRLEEQKKKLKPVFKVGVIHRKATGSPLSALTNAFAKKNYLNLKHPKRGNAEEGKGVVTRSKAKLLPSNQVEAKPTSTFVKIIGNQKKPIGNHKFVVPKAVSELTNTKKIAMPSSNKITKENERKPLKPYEFVIPNIDKQENAINKAQKVSQPVTTEKKERSFNGEHLGSQLSNAMSSMELNSPKLSSSTTDDYVPIHYSPFVCKTRGSLKRSSRGSKKISLSMNVDQEIEKEENVFRCRIHSFRKYVECQTERLLERCKTWKKIADTEDLPAEVQGEIASVIGKTQLLTSDKFKQFKDLIDKCENKDHMIKVEDLQGFQDWVSLEVDRLDDTFYNLERKQENGWMAIQETQKKNVNTNVQKAKMNKNSKVQSGKSNIREHILAARKLMKQSTKNFSPLCELKTWSNATSPRKGTPKKSESLMREVLNSATKKRISNFVGTPENKKTPCARNSGLEMLLATQYAKSLTPGKSPIIPFVEEPKAIAKSSATPRSILKQPSSLSSKRSVVFNNNKGILEKYFAPLNDDSFSERSIKMGDENQFSSCRKRKCAVATPSRRSSRLAERKIVFT